MSHSPQKLVKELERLYDLQIEKEIGRSARSVVYLAKKGNESLAIKIPQKSSRNPDNLWQQYYKEAAALGRMDHPCLPNVITVDRIHGIPFLVTEFIPGIPLSSIISSGKPLSLAQVLDIGLTLSSALIDVHGNGLIHRDIKAQNILIDTKFNPYLMDFGLAIRHSALAVSKEAVGTLEYCAPEQTGMVNRAVDHRADLYSLGVVLFQCSTGHLPFQSDDPEKLVSQHVLKPPPLIRQFRRDFSTVLEGIILVLMAKDPDNRYQTASGLLYDLDNLENIENHFNKYNEIILGSNDQAFRSRSEAKLIGREQEKNKLLEIWQKTKKGHGHTVLIDGEPGSGKTRLVREILKESYESDNAPLLGKSPQKNQIPFGPLRETLDSFLSHLQGLPGQKRNDIRIKLREGLKEFAPILSGFHSNFSSFLNLPQISARNADSQEQLYGVLAEFFVRLAGLQGPTILFIDDIQWLDDASSEVLKRIAKQVSDLPIFLGFAARNDTKSIKKVSSFIRDIGMENITQIHLNYLNEREMELLISDQLGGKCVDSKFVRHISILSNGNPFAIREYLRALWDAGVLRPSWGTWEIDSRLMERVNLTSDLVQIITHRISFLTKRAQSILSVAALISNKMDIELLTRVCSTNENIIQDAIEEALQSHLIEKVHGLHYSFIHDKIQEALINGLEINEKQKWHQRIAESLHRLQASGGSDEFTYALAQHYYLGQAEQNSETVFETNFLAGTKALKDHATEEAYVYMRHAQQAAIRANITTSSQFNSVLADACIKTRRDEEAIRALTTALEKESKPVLRAKIRVKLARVFIANRQIKNCWNECDKAFTEIGHHRSSFRFVSVMFTIITWLKAMLLIRFSFLTKRAKGKNLERFKTIVDCLEVAIQAAYYKSDPAFFFFGVQALYPALRIGISRELSFAYSISGLNLALVKSSKRANAYSIKALQVAEQLGDPFVIARAQVWQAITKNFIGEWDDTEKILDQLLSSRSHWIDTTDFMNLCGCLMFQATCNGFSEVCMDTTNKGIRRLSLSQADERIVKYHPYFSYQLIALPLLGRTNEIVDYIEGCEAHILKTPEDRFGAGLFYSSLLGFYYENEEFGPDIESAIEKYRQIDQNDPALTTLHSKHFYMYQAYVRLSQCLRSNLAGQSYTTKNLEFACKQLVQATRLPNCPSLVSHSMVIQSGLHFLKGDLEKSLTMLAQAETLAKRSNCPLATFEALRLRGHIFRDLKKIQPALSEANQAFSLAKENGWINRMGWIIKEFKLNTPGGSMTAGNESLHPHTNSYLPSNLLSAEKRQSHFPKNTPASAFKERRYASALLKVSLAAGAQLDLTEQARSALDELIYALGAERAFLFDADSTDLSRIDFVIGRNAHKQDIATPIGYSAEVVKEVTINIEPLIVKQDDNNAIGISKNMADLSLKSIMAAPLIVDSKLVGVLYLDSQIIKGLFTEDDLYLLQSIANQIAVARRTAQMAQDNLQKEKLQSNLVRFLPSNVIKNILDGSLVIEEGPKELPMTVLFSDLVGFTGLIGQFGAEKSFIILNDLLDKMINVIFKHGGTIDKFIGDAIMVVFGAPEELPVKEQVLRAANCASQMQNELELLSSAWQTHLGTPPVEMRIGIHHGPAIIGNFGNAKRTEYSAIGQTVNIAARIEAVCAPGGVYFSEAVAHFLPEQNIERLGLFELKGIQGKMSLYKLVLNFPVELTKAS